MESLESNKLIPNLIQFNDLDNKADENINIIP